MLCALKPCIGLCFGFFLLVKWIKGKLHSVYICKEGNVYICKEGNVYICKEGNVSAAKISNFLFSIDTALFWWFS
jgi:hypothetical protein